MHIMGLLLSILGSVLVAVIGYLLGSANSAIIVTRLWAGKDIRDYGSGNAGMTNVLRSFGKIPAVLTILGDFSKGVVAVLAARLVFFLLHITFMDGAYIAGFFALLGHLFPVYFGFKGGKGVLVSGAIICVINPWAFLILLVTFFVVFIPTRIVSLGSLACAAVYPVATFLLLLLSGRPILGGTFFGVLMALIVAYMHRENIRRLLNGTESKFRQKK